MPRRKFQPRPAYRPHAGTSPKRTVTPGEARDDAARPVRILNYHACGESIFRGARDFDGMHWRTTFHATREGAEILKCPSCSRVLLPDEVTTHLPGEEGIRGIPE